MYTNTPRDKTDLRVRRTRKLLWEALLALLQDRSFESLTIQEICERAMVHRTTFYKHFEDKYHLFVYGMEEIKEILADKSYEDRLLRPMQTFESLSRTLPLQNLLRSQPENGTLSTLMQTQACKSLREDLLEAEKNGSRFPVPIDVLAAFYAGAVSSLSAWWLLTGMAIPAREMDRYLQTMIDRHAFFPGSAPAAPIPATAATNADSPS